MIQNDFSYGNVNLDLFNGQVSVKRTINEVSGLKFGYNLSIVVSNNLSNPFKLNIEKKITVDSSDSNIYYYEDENGLIYKYTYSNSGFCYTRSNIKRGLVKLTNGYEIVYPSSEKEIYNSDGQITSIVNKANETICTYTYNTNNKLASFTCGSHTIIFNYDSSNRLISAVKSNETLLQVTYNTNNTLITIGNVKYEITGSTNTFTVRTLTSSNVVKEQFEKVFNNDCIGLTYYVEGVAQSYTIIYGPFIDSSARQVRKVQDFFLDKTTAYVYESYKLVQTYELFNNMFIEDNGREYYKGDIQIYDRLTSSNGIIKQEDYLYTENKRGFVYSVDNTNHKFSFTFDVNSNLVASMLQQTVYVSFWVEKDYCPASSFTIFANNEELNTVYLNDLNDGWNFICYPLIISGSFQTVFSDLYIKFNDFTGTQFLTEYFKDVRMTFTGPNLNYHQYKVSYLSTEYDISKLKVSYQKEGSNIVTEIYFKTIDEIKSFLVLFLKNGNLKKNVFAYDYQEVHEIYNFTWQLNNGESYSSVNILDIVLKDKKIRGKEIYLREIYKVNITDNLRHIQDKLSYYNPDVSESYLTISKTNMNNSYEITKEEAQGIIKDYTYNNNLLTNEVVTAGALKTVKETTYVNQNFVNDECINENEVIAYMHDSNGNLTFKQYNNGDCQVPEYYIYTDNLLTKYTKKAKSLEYTYTDNNLSKVKENNLNYNFEYNKNKVSLIKENTYNVAGFEYLNNDLDVITKVYTSDSAFYAYKDTYNKYGKLTKRVKYTSSAPSEVTVLENEYKLPSGVTEVTSASVLKVQNFGSKEYRYNYDDNRNIKKIEEYQNDSLKYSVSYKYENKNTNASLVSNIVLKQKKKLISNVNYTEDYNYSNDYLTSKKITSVTLSKGNTEYGTLNYSYNSMNQINNINYTIGDKIFNKNYTYKEVSSSTNTYQTGFVSSVYYSDNRPVNKFVEIIYYDNNNIKELKSDYVSKVSYVYDDYNRLVRENNYDLNLTYTYEYDDNGNITSKKKYAYTTGDLGTLKTQYNYTYSTTRLNQLTSYYNKQTGINYEGNTTILNDYTLSYSYGKLVNATKGSMASSIENISYTYDNNGLRIQKKYTYTPGEYPYSEYILSKTHNYTYVLGQLFKEEIITVDANRVSSTEIIEYNYINNELIGFTYTNASGVSKEYIYERNIFNDVEFIYDLSTGNIVAKYAYDAYGNCTIKTNVGNIANLNPIRYRGYYYDSELRIYYCNARYYNQEWGRWISPDSIDYLDPSSINGLNLYCYCFNNPIMYSDSTGTTPQWISILGSTTENFLNFSEMLLNTVLMPKSLSMAQAKILARKGGHLYSARQLIRGREDDIARTLKLSKNISRAANLLGGALFVVDVVSTCVTNYNSGSDSWVTDSMVDTLIDGAIFVIGFIPGWGWIVSLGLAGIKYLIEENTTWIDDLKKVASEEPLERWLLFGFASLLIGEN